MQILIELDSEMGGGGPGKAPRNEESLQTPSETPVRGVEYCLYDINEIMESGEVMDVGS